ncbi:MULTISPECIES: potassium channel family protein [unclassified Moritella]|uniref:potassium channel family protein n=1 Tax=unclassified Moritella TaxID=2637987 RepID=UPI001BA44F44|nr:MULTISPECIES: potassium channel family protein [unclassified Moritella]QUM83082.1 potassium channel [Moritella sp. 28]QUM87383.1 potassium channel [Moritella sp. 36]
MYISRLISLALRKLTAELRWANLFFIFCSYLAVVWGLLWLADESTLIEPLTFFYYTVVVISTVGFGDLSPTTAHGQLVVALVQIPFGLLIFGAAIGKTTQAIVTLARKGMNGKKDFSTYSDHILILGWRAHRTKRILDLILADKKRYKRKIILCVERDMNHPFPQLLDVEFAKLESFTDHDELVRIAIAQASSIIVDGENDEMTLSMALSASSHASKQAHISAYFHEESKADLLRAHCPNVECASSRHAEILVRTMQSPGASIVHEQLFSTLDEATLYCLTLEDAPEMTVGDVFQPLREKYSMTLMAIADDEKGTGFKLNPAMDTQLRCGQVLHYIANERIRKHEINWVDVLLLKIDK